MKSLDWDWSACQKKNKKKNFGYCSLPTYAFYSLICRIFAMYLFTLDLRVLWYFRVHHILAKSVMISLEYISLIVRLLAKVRGSAVSWLWGVRVLMMVVLYIVTSCDFVPCVQKSHRNLLCAGWYGLVPDKHWIYTPHNLCTTSEPAICHSLCECLVFFLFLFISCSYDFFGYRIFLNGHHWPPAIHSL